jgi:protein gp37
VNKTKIEWTDYTWNPITGCKKDCPYCYAAKIAHRFAGSSAFPYGFTPTYHYDRLAQHWPTKPSKIFTCSMGELFGDWLPEWQIGEIFSVIRMYPQHTFQLLTKQPQNLIKWSPFPPNCWIGSSVTNGEMMSRAYIGLKQITASVKFISYEPLLENVFMESQFLEDAGINWLIIGQQTPQSAKTMPHISWVQQIVDESNKARIPVFLKNNLKGFLPFRQYDGPWMEVYKLRQEFPELLSGVPGME